MAILLDHRPMNQHRNLISAFYLKIFSNLFLCFFFLTQTKFEFMLYLIKKVNLKYFGYNDHMGIIFFIKIYSFYIKGFRIIRKRRFDLRASATTFFLN